MLTFRDMTLDDRDTVLPMVDAFYRSNAVDHPVPREIVERSFLAAAGNEPLLRGTLIFEVGIGQAPEVEEILAQNGFEQIQTTADTQGIWRVVEGTING